MDALAHSTPVVSHRGCVVQARVLRSRVLRNRVYGARPDFATQGDGRVARSERSALQVHGFGRHLEQLVRVGRDSGFHLPSRGGNPCI